VIKQKVYKGKIAWFGMNQLPNGQTQYLSINGRVKPALRDALGLVLDSYVPTVEFWAPKKSKVYEDYTIRQVCVAGSVLQGNSHSDLDLLLIGNKLDGEDYRFIKQVMAQLFFVSRPKTQAIDVFIRPHDEFPEKPSYDITTQVQDLVSKCNGLILNLGRTSEERRQVPRAKL
jgi:hypothetical protein